MPGLGMPKIDSRVGKAKADARRLERAFIAEILRAESEAIVGLIERLGEELNDAVDLVSACVEAGGSVHVTGMGKSGAICQKISATLKSLGVPSHFIHPSEALHGDVGQVRSKDCVIALSFSGETEEVVALAAVLRQDGVSIVSITGGEGRSALARAGSVSLTLGQITEASDLGLAPTCSTAAMLALGDALALAVARRRAFTAEDFARYHPGGSLGGLLRPVVDVLRFSAGKNLEVVEDGRSVRAALEAAEHFGRRPGALLLVDGAGKLSGIFTDGDLRRLILEHPEKLDGPIRDAMTRSPRALRDDALVRDAVRMVRELRADEIPIVDGEGRPVGLLDVQDLVALKVVHD